jgi:hypothetical protein
VAVAVAVWQYGSGCVAVAVAALQWQCGCVNGNTTVWQWLPMLQVCQCFQYLTVCGSGCQSKKKKWQWLRGSSTKKWLWHKKNGSGTKKMAVALIQTTNNNAAIPLK